MATAIHLRKDRLDSLRTARGLTSDTALADKAGVSRVSIYRATKGDALPGPKMISGLCTALGVEFEDLFEVVELAA